MPVKIDPADPRPKHFQPGDFVVALQPSWQGGVGPWPYGARPFRVESVAEAGPGLRPVHVIEDAMGTIREKMVTSTIGYDEGPLWRRPTRYEADCLQIQYDRRDEKVVIEGHQIGIATVRFSPLPSLASCEIPYAEHAHSLFVSSLGDGGDAGRGEWLVHTGQGVLYRGMDEEKASRVFDRLLDEPEAVLNLVMVGDFDRWDLTRDLVPYGPGACGLRSVAYAYRR